MDTPLERTAFIEITRSQSFAQLMADGSDMVSAGSHTDEWVEWVEGDQDRGHVG